MLKYSFILIFIVLLTTVLPAQKNQMPGTTGLTCMNYIIIDGETNISDFEFSAIFPEDEGPEIFRPVSLEVYPQVDYLIKIPVKEFKTKNPLMYKDFLELIREETYPYITLRIDRKDLKNIVSYQNKVRPSVRIRLAGVSRTYTITCFVEPCSDNRIFISGTQTIRLSDFNIEASVKSFGLIKVKNEVIINFGFRL